MVRQFQEPEQGLFALSGVELFGLLQMAAEPGVGDLLEEAAGLPAPAEGFAFADKPGLGILLTQPVTVVEDQHSLQEAEDRGPVASLQHAGRLAFIDQLGADALQGVLALDQGEQEEVIQLGQAVADGGQGRLKGGQLLRCSDDQHQLVEQGRQHLGALLQQQLVFTVLPEGNEQNLHQAQAGFRPPGMAAVMVEMLEEKGAVAGQNQAPVVIGVADIVKELLQRGVDPLEVGHPLQQHPPLRPQLKAAYGGLLQIGPQGVGVDGRFTNPVG